MRCTHYTYPDGWNTAVPTAVRCEAPATHWLYAPDGQPCPGAATCLEHGQAVVEEYAAKLGETWTLRPVDEHGRLVIDPGDCTHPPARRSAWFARDDTAPAGQVLCIACCDCGAILAGEATLEATR